MATPSGTRKPTPCAQTQTRVGVLEETAKLQRARIADLELRLGLLVEEVAELHTGTQLRLDAHDNGGMTDTPEALGHMPIEALTGFSRGRK